MSQSLDYARPLRREIGLPGAVMLGLGAILGSGVFVGLPQATAIAGPWVIVSILLAGGLAFCNAMSSAQLAAAHPVSGGTYEYGYRLLSLAWGFVAGWSFLLAKSASAATAAIALVKAILIVARLVGSDTSAFESRTIGDFAVIATSNSSLVVRPSLAATNGIAAAAIVALLAATLSGVRRTSALNTCIVAVTLAGLVALIGTFFDPVHPSRIWGLLRTLRDSFATNRVAPNAIVQAAAITFVAFAGYARLATMGEEVREPTRKIPRAMSLCLAIAIVLYLLLSAIVAFHYRRMSIALDVHDFRDWDLLAIGQLIGLTSQLWQRIVQWTLTLAAVTALIGVLLNLLLGLSRVWLAMGRRGDMPAILARVSQRTGTPVPATIVSGIVIALLVIVGRDVRTTWAFSAFSVLIYYAITNIACLRLPAEARRYPRALAWIGLFACLSLAWFVEVRVWAAGVTLIGFGLVWHLWRRRRALFPSPP